MPTDRPYTRRALFGSPGAALSSTILTTVYVRVRTVNCNIFLCDDSDCDDNCRVIEGRDQVEVAADMGIVYGNVRDGNGENFEIDLDSSTTYYIWTNIGDACVP
eukprot:COSAG06_NODE_79_length_25437_cov_12.062673_30_plen_104_part_00